MRIETFEITRFQFTRDRVVGDSQVRANDVAAVELIDENGLRGLGFAQTLFVPVPPLAEITRVFELEVWPGLKWLVRCPKWSGSNIRSRTSMPWSISPLSQLTAG